MILIMLISLCYIGGCSISNNINEDGSKNDLGNYITFEKISITTELDTDTTKNGYRFQL